MRQNTAETLMERITPQWERIKTEWGILYRAEYDWYGEVVDGEYRTFPPRLKDGTNVPVNRLASQFFKESITGECFLFPSDAKREDFMTFIAQSHVKYTTA